MRAYSSPTLDKEKAVHRVDRFEGAVEKQNLGSVLREEQVEVVFSCVHHVFRNPE